MFRTLISAVRVLPEQAHNHFKSMFKEGYTSICVSHILLSFQNNTIYLIRLVLLDLYGFPLIRRTIHITHFIAKPQHVCSPRVTAGFATDLARITHSGAQLLGDLSPPTMNHTHKTPIPTTMAHTNRQYRLIATHVLYCINIIITILLCILVCFFFFFSSAVPPGSGAFQMPTCPSSSAAAASASTLRGGRANLRNASVTFSLFLHEASLG